MSVSRFYLTTAIDYVNSRPHLGHGLRKDRRRRHRPLPPAVRRRHAFRDGQRRALAERLPEGAASRASSRWPTATGWSTCSATSGTLLDISFDDFIRTTQPRHRAAVQSWSGGSWTTATSTRASTRAGTASAARRSSRRRIWSTASVRSTAPSRTGSARRTTSSGCRSISDALLAALRRASGVSAAGHPPQRDAAAARGRARRHLGQPRRAVVGHSAAVRSVERGLRLVRRADQLRVGGRATAPTRDVRRSGGRPTCTSSARTSRGSTRCLAGDADERRPAAAARRCSATAAFFKGQQMSKSLGTAVDPLEAASTVRRRSAAAVSGRGSAFGGDGDFSWERFEKRYNADLANNLGNLVNRITTMAERYAAAGGADRRRPDQLAGVAATALAAYRGRWTVRAARGRGGRLPPGQCDQRVHRRDRAVGAGERPDNADRLSQVLFDAAEAVRIAAVLLCRSCPGFWA